MAPLTVKGRTVHQVGLPYHFGWKGIVTGDVANDLLAISESPNVRIMESKALVCNLVPGRREQGPAALRELKELLEESA
jgi:formate dehydrogenase major subunit